MSVTQEIKAQATRGGAARRLRPRSLWVAVHKWIGLALGLVVAIIGLTGSILVFYQEIDEWLNPALYAVAPPYPGAAFRATDEIFAAARAAAPSDAVPGFTVYPPHDRAAYAINFTRQRKDSAFEDFWQVFVDPYSARVTGRRDVRTGDQWFSRAFIPFIFDLHLCLLMPYQQGRIIVGIIAILAVLSIASGLLLWWPSPGKWRRALGVRWRASGKRLTYDLHQVFGIYPWLVLLAVLVSGISFNLPGTFLSLVRVFSPATIDASTLTSARGSSDDVVSIGAAMTIADARSPAGRTLWIAEADGRDATHWICKNGQFEASRIFDVQEYVAAASVPSACIASRPQALVVGMGDDANPVIAKGYSLDELTRGIGRGVVGGWFGALGLLARQPTWRGQHFASTITTSNDPSDDDDLEVGEILAENRG